MKKSIRTYYLNFILLILSGFIAPAIMAQPIAEVGGIINADRLFTKDSLYIVTGNLRVTNGARLKIEAGTKLRFNQRTGLVIEAAKLEAVGIVDEQVDSIYFEPNYIDPAQSWKWDGILISNASTENNVVLSYVVVADAEKAVEINNSSHVILENSCFIDNFWRGIIISNSTHVNLKNSVVSDNYIGVDIVGSGLLGVAAYNLIQNNVLRNEATNIFIRNETGGNAYQNRITENVVQQGINGIWIDNGGEGGSRRNYVTKNAILNNGNGLGYGLHLGMDSTEVIQNIFWQNLSAIEFRNSSNSIISGNSFYQNGNSLPLKVGSKRNNISKNTFSLNQETAVIIAESVGIVFSKNNFIHSITDTLVELRTEQNINGTINYWGTTSEDEISTKIIDFHDDPGLGELFSVPFLTEADTAAPLAPPFELKKQWVNDHVRLSWRANEESDFSSYTVYFRNFVNYSFSENLVDIQDTVLNLHGYTIADTFAVTATDGGSVSHLAKFLGHESPYAFAKAAPYAGSDTAICQNEQVFVILEANAPFDYEQLRWLSSGDGSFTVPTSLNTSYLPGIEDYERGEVRLSLEVTTSDEIFIESFILSFSSDPFAFAGNDTLIGSDSSLQLQTASAAYFDQINWQTTGDGVFQDPNLTNTLYIPGDQDRLNGAVYLILNAVSECGMATDTLKLMLLDEFSLEGSVYTEKETPSNAVVLAFRLSDEEYSYISREHTALDGSFYFKKLFQGDYVLMAMPDTLNKLAATAYYAEASAWEEAHKLKLTEPTFDVDIKLANRLNNFPAGNARISGHFAWPENGFDNNAVYCADWFSRDNQLQYCDEGLSNVSITLYNTDLKVLLSYTLSDFSGHFVFDSLPFGSYRIHAEIPGYPLNVSPFITLSGDQPTAYAELRIENKKISIYAENAQPLINSKTTAYPNPVSDYLVIQFPDLKELTIYDRFGRLLEVLNFEPNASKTNITLDMQAYKSGLYILQLKSENHIQRLKIVKK